MQIDNNILQFSKRMEDSPKRAEHLKRSSGGGNSGGMDQRIAKLEGRFDQFEKRIDERFDEISRRLEHIDKRMERIEDKIPSKWDLAQVVFYIAAALMAAAIFAPRILSMVPQVGPTG